MLSDTQAITNILQIMQIAAIVGSVIFVLSRTIEANKTNAKTNEAIVERIGGVENEIKELSKVVVSNARLDERLTAALLRITALEARRNFELAERRYQYQADRQLPKDEGQEPER
jgi:hypothetical protein